MINKELLPSVDPIEVRRYIAGKIGHDALYHQKSDRHTDFNRPTAGIEREYMNHLPLSKIGEAALLQLGEEDTTFHLESLS